MCTIQTIQTTPHPHPHPHRPDNTRQMDKLIIPAGEPNPQRFSTVQEVCAKLQGGKKTKYDVVRFRCVWNGIELDDETAKKCKFRKKAQPSAGSWCGRVLVVVRRV